MNKIEELRKYAVLEGSEIGEVCMLLCELSGYFDYISDSFKEAVDKEVSNQLSVFESQAEIVEKEQSRTWKYQELVWKESYD